MSPSAFDAEHVRADLLRHGALHAGVTLEPLPSQIHDVAFVGLCMRHFETLRPLHRWLVDNV